MTLSPEEWHGPVRSGYGVHLVYLHSISKPSPPRFSEVRERVQREWEAEKRESLNEQFYASLRERYTIVIDKPEVDQVAALREVAQ